MTTDHPTELRARIADIEQELSLNLDSERREQLQQELEALQFELSTYSSEERQP